MIVAEIFSIIFIFITILCGIIIKECWEYLDFVADSLSSRILLKIAIFLSLLLISFSAFFVCNTIIS